MRAGAASDRTGGEVPMIDAMDKKLVRSLNANARKSFREMAKELGMSTTSVIRGIKKLETAGAVKGYIPVVDPAAFGYDLTVVVLLTINQGRLVETQRQIGQDYHVACVLDITGEWDSLVIAHFQGREDLNSFLKKINAMKNVSRTMTNIVLNTIKNEARIHV
jgi:DNA-binding Lrp family transcriptional regulator